MYADLLSGTKKLDLVKAVETDLDDWYVITLNQLVRVCQNVSSKYTRSKSAEVASQRILVYHSGVVARKLNGSQQTGVY